MVILGANNIALHILFVLISLLILLCLCAYNVDVYMHM